MYHVNKANQTGFMNMTMILMFFNEETELKYSKLQILLSYYLHWHRPLICKDLLETIKHEIKL